MDAILSSMGELDVVNVYLTSVRYSTRVNNKIKARVDIEPTSHDELIMNGIRIRKNIPIVMSKTNHYRVIVVHRVCRSFIQKDIAEFCDKGKKFFITMK